MTIFANGDLNQDELNEPNPPSDGNTSVKHIWKEILTPSPGSAGNTHNLETHFLKRVMPKLVIWPAHLSLRECIGGNLLLEPPEVCGFCI